MTEDEEWEAVQSYHAKARLIKARSKAVEAAHRLADEYKDSMAYFTTVKAFELGYMEALKDDKE